MKTSPSLSDETKNQASFSLFEINRICRRPRAPRRPPEIVALSALRTRAWFVWIAGENRGQWETHDRQVCEPQVAGEPGAWPHPPKEGCPLEDGFLESI